MRPNDPLAEKEAVSAQDLENMPLILPRRTNVQNELANSVLAWKKQQPFSLATAKFIDYIRCFLGMARPLKLSI